MRLWPTRSALTIMPSASGNCCSSLHKALCALALDVKKGQRKEARGKKQRRQYRSESQVEQAPRTAEPATDVSSRVPTDMVTPA